MLRELMRRMLRAMPGEERAVGLAFAYFFMLMCSYYLLRPLRDAMAIGAGLKNLPWLYTGTFAAMLVLTPLFGALVARVRKPLLLPMTYGFFASNLLVFYLLFKAMPDARWLATSFFIWLSAFNMFVVSVFWSFMVDVFRDEEAKRLFGPIAAGGGTGAILGPLLMQFLAPRIGVDAVVGLAMLFLLGTLPCIRGLASWAEARHGQFVLPPDDPQARIGGGVLSGLLLVARSPYLLGIFALIALGSIAGVFMYNELLRLVEAATRTLRRARNTSARVDFAVNAHGMAVPGRRRRLADPALRAAGRPGCGPRSFRSSHSSRSRLPRFLVVLAAGQVVRRGGEYGIAKPSREVLFTAVDAETKYKAKNFIDTVMQRGSDMVGVWLFFAVQAAGVGLVGYSWICAVMMLAAIVLVAVARPGFERRQAGTSWHDMVQLRSDRPEATMKERKESGPRMTRREALALLACLAAPRMAAAAADPIQRAIPRTGEKLPALGLGTWQVLDVPARGADFDAALAAVRGFLEAGGRVIDSSPMYGRSEERVGDILAAIRPAARPSSRPRSGPPGAPPAKRSSRTRTGSCARRRSTSCRSTTSRISTRTCRRCGPHAMPARSATSA